MQTVELLLLAYLCCKLNFSKTIFPFDSHTFQQIREGESKNDKSGHVTLVARITHPDKLAHICCHCTQLESHGGRHPVQGESSKPTGCQQGLTEILYLQATVDDFFLHKQTLDTAV